MSQPDRRRRVEVVVPVVTLLYSAILAGTFRFTFARAGDYHYYCTVHPWMKGSITVTGG